MKLSESWLREYLDINPTAGELIEQLTMAGVEVGSYGPVSGSFSGVVVAHVLEVASHPDAERLRVCSVLAGVDQQPLQIVCGAPNVVAGMRAALAIEGAVLPDGLTIKRSRLRGVESFGMLCSEKELGIEEDSNGLMVLPGDAPVGADLRDYLGLDDHSIEVDLTPNRADCLSVWGLAREVSVLNGIDPVLPQIQPIKSSTQDQVDVKVTNSQGCPRYLGRVIKGVNPSSDTPLWMKEKLRRSGLRSISAIVDITNYVLLELGQPMHAFDLQKINGSIIVRNAVDGEKLHLLNEQQIKLEADTLVISDRDGPLALAGIMGGSASAVSNSTQEIFLECAFFSPTEIMGKARKYGLNTDSSHRFERGVSYELQQEALEYATQLILQISGGHAGPVIEQTSKADLPVRSPIALRKSEVLRVLGLDLDDTYIETTLHRLGLQLNALGEEWQCIPPAHRFDMAIEADLIEELGRVYGYDKIPIRRPLVPAIMQPCSESVLSESRVKDIMVDRGYQEAITYSFVDPKLQAQIDPEFGGLPLCNPISSEMAVMRTNLWVGLLDAALRNNNRQIKRVRLFETGLRFIQDQLGLKQVKTLAFLSMGPLVDEQWGLEQKEVDFFDVKSDLEGLLELTGRSETIQFLRETKACLHPGQSARVYVGGHPLGWIGMLHPQLERTLGFEGKVFLVELDLDLIVQREIPRFKRLSKFPSVRRDLAVLVRESVEVGELLGSVKGMASPLIRDFSVFDVYQGAGIEPGFKSVAFRLVLQDDHETLTDSIVEQSVQGIFKFFEEKFEARLRD